MASLSSSAASCQLSGRPVHLTGRATWRSSTMSLVMQIRVFGSEAGFAGWRARRVSRCRIVRRVRGVGLSRNRICCGFIADQTASLSLRAPGASPSSRNCIVASDNLVFQSVRRGVEESACKMDNTCCIAENDRAVIQCFVEHFGVVARQMHQRRAGP